MLADFRLHEEVVVVWFEHDLADQLQILQTVDWFRAQDQGKTRLGLIQIDFLSRRAAVLRAGPVADCRFLNRVD